MRDQSGVAERSLAILKGPFHYGVASPDGNRAIAKYAAGTETNLWSVDLSTGAYERLTPPPWKSREPYWFPDSRHIVFEYYAPRGHEVCSVDVTDGSPAQPLFRCPSGSSPTAVLGDARAVLLDGGDSSADVIVAERDSAWRFRPYAASVADETNGTFFGDGHWIAFATTAAGGIHIAADRYPVPGSRVFLTREAVGQPHDLRRFWVAGSKLIYALEDGRTLRCADLTISADQVSAGPPRTLFTVPQDCRGVALSADGTRILLETPVGPRPPPTLAIIQNWELLSRPR